MRKNHKVPYILALTLTTSGCELIGPKQHEKLSLDLVEQVEDNKQPDLSYQALSKETVDKDALGSQLKTELYPGSGRFVAQQSPDHGHDKTQEKGEYSLNFDDADLGEVAKVILSDILGKNYLLSPKIGGKVTLQTTEPLKRAELMPTLEMLLQVNNAAMVYQNGLYQIKPAAEVVTSSAFAGYGKSWKMPSGHQIRVVPVNNVGVEELAEIIKPLMQEKTILHIDSNRNIMLIAGTKNELVRALEMVNAFDVDVMKGKSFGLFSLQNVEAVKIIEELEQLFNSKSKDGGGFFRFMEIERLNAILAITHRAEFLQEIERWILRLDRANNSAGGGVNVYRAQHVDAVELAATLNEIFSKGGKTAQSGSVAAGRKVVEVTNKKQPDNKTDQATSNQKTPSFADVGDVKIIADEINNALVIVATAQDYAVIQRVIKQLDVMPLQVLIDATIVDVTLKDNLKYGIQWFFSHENGGENNITGGGSFFNNIASLGAAAVTGGFGYSFVSNSGDIRAVLSAEASNGNLNVISSPSLMVLNNQEANIQVGDEISLRTSQNTPTNTNIDVNSTLISTSQLQQRKTGVKLKVKPRVNASGLVIMEIEQSVEDFAGGETNGNPNILTREIASAVAVQSGETIVLGGLIKEKNNQDKTGVPLLHKLPLIGPLFGSTTNTKDKTELVVLITPRVVRGKQDARLVADEFKRKLTGIYRKPVETVEEM